MRQIFLALLTLSIATTQASAAPAGPTTISLQPFGPKQLMVHAAADGVAGDYLFDTGEGVTMISPEVAARIGCKPWGDITGFRMMGARIDTKRCDAVRFSVGGFEAVAPEVMVLDFAALAGPGGPKIDGVIGLDLFNRQSITLDLQHRSLTVETPASFAARTAHAAEIPARLVKDAEGAALAVDLGVTTPLGTAWMEMDTGNGSPTAIVSSTVAPALGLSAAAPADPKAAPRQAVTLALGSIALRGEARVFPNMIMDGNIGPALVHDRVVMMDLQQGRVWVSQ